MSVDVDVAPGVSLVNGTIRDDSAAVAGDVVIRLAARRRVN